MRLWKHFRQLLILPRSRQAPMYFLGLMLLFWTLYEGMIAYLTPLVIANAGFSKTMIGIIIGSASVAGALFDFVACRIFPQATFRRLFLFVFILCLTYPILLFKANSLLVYLIAMAIWGIYYDLKNISCLDFVARATKKTEHTESFAVISIYQSIGFLIGPIIVGIFVADAYDWKPFAMAYIFLFISFCFFLGLLFLSRQTKVKQPKKSIPQIVFLAEWNLWRKVSIVLFPVLFLGFFLNTIDAFFWTIGPLIAESFVGLNHFAGLFMTAYTLPALIVGWGVGSLTRKFGKKRTSYVTLLIGSLLLCPLLFLTNPLFIVINVFLSSLSLSLCWPALSGAYADYISETDKYAKEIETVVDCSTNIGYVVGPVLAGISADHFGNAGAFFWLGLVGAGISIMLLITTSHPISVLKSLSKRN